MHLPVMTNIPTRDVFFQGGKAALTANTGTAIVFYRAAALVTTSVTNKSPIAWIVLSLGKANPPGGWRARLSEASSGAF